MTRSETSNFCPPKTCKWQTSSSLIFTQSLPRHSSIGTNGMDHSEIDREKQIEYIVNGKISLHEWFLVQAKANINTKINNDAKKKPCLWDVRCFILFIRGIQGYVFHQGRWMIWEKDPPTFPWNSGFHSFHFCKSPLSTYPSKPPFHSIKNQCDKRNVIDSDPR